MSSRISKMLFTFSHPQPIPNGYRWVGLILQNQFYSFVWFCVVLFGNESRFSCLEFYSYYSIEQAFIKVSLSKRGLCSAHIPAKSRTIFRSASCFASILAMATKCFLVIHYQWVGLYKGFFTWVEKSPSWTQHGWAGDTSLRLTCGRSLSARPFAVTCQASPLVSHSGWFIRHSS